MDKELVFFKIDENGCYVTPELPKHMSRSISIQGSTPKRGYKKITIEVIIDEKPEATQ